MLLVDTLALVLHNDAMLLAHELTSLQLKWRRVLSNVPFPHASSSVVSAPPPPPPPTSCQLADLAWHARTVAMRYFFFCATPFNWLIWRCSRVRWQRGTRIYTHVNTDTQTHTHIHTQRHAYTQGHARVSTRSSEKKVKKCG